MSVDSVVVDGVFYDVSMNYDSDGVMEYFNLCDSDGEIVFEADWQGDITADEIVEMYRSYVSANTVVEDDVLSVSVDDSSDGSVGEDSDGDSAFVNDGAVVDFSFFDEDFPHLVDYPVRLKKIAMDRCDSFVDESFAFQKIVVGELVDYFDECVEDGDEAVAEFYRLEES